MIYKILFFLSCLLCLCFSSVTAQSYYPCSFEEVMLKNSQNPAQTLQNFETNQQFTQAFIKNLRAKKQDLPSTYVIPVVLHIFHNGEEGMISEEQAISSMDVLNADMKGLNDDFNDIHPRFDSIKATIDVEFCLATIDPQGNPTNGIIYYDNEPAMYNSINLSQFAWDNFSYLNIYLPKYAFGEPSIYTAYAYFPDINNSIYNGDGIVHSSYRWGLGSMSELTTENDRISIVTHEVGHWLNLFHTFENGCSSPGDYVDDTPPTVGSDPAPTGCNNFGLTCNVPTNGSNYMDYNLDCKKMFTEGQVERMTAALHLPERSFLWSEENLIATGCASTNNCNGLMVSFTGLPNSLTIQNSAYLTGSPAGGTFSGPGISFSVFNTSFLSPGVHTINYTYTNEDGCSASSSQSVLVYSISFQFVNYTLNTIDPKTAPQYADFLLEVHTAQTYAVEIFDIEGRLLHQSKPYLNVGTYIEQFYLDAPLHKGVFFMKVTTDDFSEIRKFIR